MIKEELKHKELILKIAKLSQEEKGVALLLNSYLARDQAEKQTELLQKQNRRLRSIDLGIWSIVGWIIYNIVKAL